MRVFSTGSNRRTREWLNFGACLSRGRWGGPRAVGWLALSGLVVAGLWSPAARADVSSWLYVGGGASRLDDTSLQPSIVPDLQLDTGLGTSPADAFIFGGLLRSHTHFGRGTDLGLLLRGATHGFVNGDWGLAVDIGPYQRWWGAGSSGFWGGLSLGAPWGITVSANAGMGSNQAQTFSLTLGIDLARLTVYRTTGQQWWRNPFPAYRPDERF